MTIRLTTAVRIAGVSTAADTELTLDVPTEAGLVSANKAIYVYNPADVGVETRDLLLGELNEVGVFPAVYANASSASVPLEVQSLHVAKGTPLDMSSLRRSAVPAGARGRIRIHGSDTTKLAESSASTTAVTFLTAQIALDSVSVPVPSDKAQITAAVEHLARMGFNAIRFHGIEYWLMAGTTGAFSFPEDRMDALDWLLAEAKRVGLYWVFNPRAPELYQDGAGSNRFSSMPVAAVNLKERMFTQQEARTHYETGFRLLYDRVNRYTGIHMLQDPALFLVEWINENSAQQNAQSAWPTTWTTRDASATRGTAAMTWPEWLADSAQAHGYANLAALNTSWGTSHASFAVIPSPTELPDLSLGSNQISIDVVLYCSYLDDHLADWFATFAATLGYTGLGSSIISFPNVVALRNASRKAANSLVNLHDYCHLAPAPAVSAALANSALNVPIWEFRSWLYTGGSFTSGKPAYLGEYGWPYWAQYRNQYPMLGAYAALQGAVGVSVFHQGDIFAPKYDGGQRDRTKKMYPYNGHTDPVVRFTEAALFFALHAGYVTEGSYEYEITFNDRYNGLNPRSTGRVNRSYFKHLAPTQWIAGITKTRTNWETDTADDSLAVMNTEDWYTRLAELQSLGAITADNLALESVTVNRGTVTAVDISGTIGSVTASGTQPVLTLSGSNTLVDGDYISITNLTGSGGTWPGTNNRGVAAKILQTGVANKVQIVSGLTLTGTSGFTAGTWCEMENVVQSGNKELLVSRRAKVALVNTDKFKYFSDGGALSAIYPYSTGFTNFSVVSCSTGAALFVASLDGLPLLTSQRIRIDLVGATRNSGETYTDSGKTTLQTVGDWPIVQDRVAAVLKLTRSTWGRFRLSALRMDGTEILRGPVGVTDSSLVIALDTGLHGTNSWCLERVST